MGTVYYVQNSVFSAYENVVFMSSNVEIWLDK